jgi:hypothetical protein
MDVLQLHKSAGMVHTAGMCMTCKWQSLHGKELLVVYVYTYILAQQYY